MAYDETLAERVRAVLGHEPGLTEQRMFGGLSFLINGNMCCGVMAGGLLVRVPPDDHDDALSRPRAYPFKMSDRPMRGWIQVDTAGLERDEDLARWVDTGRGYARSLPPKPPKSSKPPKRAAAKRATAKKR